MLKGCPYDRPHQSRCPAGPGGGLPGRDVGGRSGPRPGSAAPRRNRAVRCGPAGRAAGGGGHPAGRGDHRGHDDRTRRRRGRVVAGRRPGPARPGCGRGHLGSARAVGGRGVPALPGRAPARLLAVAPRSGRGTALAAPGLADRLRRRRSHHRGRGLARPLPARRGRPNQILRRHVRTRRPPARQDPTPPRPDRAGPRRAAGDRRVVVDRARQTRTSAKPRADHRRQPAHRNSSRR